MSRIAYVNGQYVHLGDAVVHMEDRGYQFADGVYEGIAVRHGRIIDQEGHLARLERSLDELRIPHPMSWLAMGIMLRTLAQKNRICDGFIYLQVTRGVARRDHPFPAIAIPAVTATIRRIDFEALKKRAATGIALKSVTDQRWPRRDIKSISLLPNILAKQEAREAGAFEAMQVMDGGIVSEGSSTNVWMVNAAGELITHPTNNLVLNGITMQRLKLLAAEMQIKVVERPFTLDEARNARELMISSTTAGCLAAVTLDGKPIADGKPGPIATRLFDAYWTFMEQDQ